MSSQDLLVPSLQSWGTATCNCALLFSMGARDSNSDPHVCIARALTRGAISLAPVMVIFELSFHKRMQLQFYDWRCSNRFIKKTLSNSFKV